MPKYNNSAQKNIFQTLNDQENKNLVKIDEIQFNDRNYQKD